MKIIFSITLVPNSKVCIGEILYLGKHVTSKAVKDVTNGVLVNDFVKPGLFGARQ